MYEFKNIVIVGVGLIGGSLGMSIKRKINRVNITGIDEEPVIKEALDRKAIDRGVVKGQIDCIRDADLIFLCTPINSILELIEDVGTRIKKDALVTDVGSTKTRIVDKSLKYINSNGYFIGGHPMTGSHGCGIKWADPLLFENCIYVLTPGEEIPLPLIHRFGSFLEKIGARVILMSPSTHDRIAAFVSHLPQIVAVSMVNMIAAHNKNNGNFLKMAAGGFRDMTRVASSPYSLWKEILETNKDNILDAIDQFTKEIQNIKFMISKDSASESFNRAFISRLSIPSDTKGFLHPHFDLYIQVEDRPGEISTISSLLAQKNINICDIEILKVREQEAGTMRLSFETNKIRTTAIRLLKNKRYNCWIRD